MLRRYKCNIQNVKFSISEKMYTFYWHFAIDYILTINGETLTFELSPFYKNSTLAIKPATGILKSALASEKDDIMCLRHIAYIYFIYSQEWTYVYTAYERKSQSTKERRQVQQCNIWFLYRPDKNASHKTQNMLPTQAAHIKLVTLCSTAPQSQRNPTVTKNSRL